MRRFLVLASLLLASAPASAYSIILHSGNGRQCYMATLLDNTPENNRRALSICDLAVTDSESDLDSYNRAAAFINRADIRMRMGDFAGVVADSNQAIAAYDGLAPAYLNLGAGMIGQRRYDEALPLLDKAINLNGHAPEKAYYDRALTKEYLGDIRGAYYDYRKAVDLNPNFQAASDELVRFKVVTTPD